MNISQLKYVLILEHSLTFDLNTDIMCMFAYSKFIYLNMPSLLFWTQKTEVFNSTFTDTCNDQFTKPKLHTHLVQNITQKKLVVG